MQAKTLAFPPSYPPKEPSTVRNQTKTPMLNNLNIYTQDLAQPHARSVIAASVSLSLYEPCLVRFVGPVDLAPSTLQGSLP